MLLRPCWHESCTTIEQLPPNFAMVKSISFGSTPCVGERILILRAQWLHRILDGTKTLEIRGQRLHEGDVWLGSQQRISGKARLGPAFRISTTKDWAASRPLHLVADPVSPYKTTWGLPLQSVTRLRDAVPFLHLPGAISIVKFRPA